MTQMMVNNHEIPSEMQALSTQWFTPRFDLFENDDGYLLTGDLPGVDPQDVDVKFENQDLTIHGKVSPRHGGNRYFTEEYGVGDFHRSFTVGELIDVSLIKAELKHGVLTVHLPKRPDAKPRKITVRAG